MWIDRSCLRGLFMYCEGSIFVVCFFSLLRIIIDLFLGKIFIIGVGGILIG